MSGSGLARQAEALGLTQRDAAGLFAAAGQGDPDATVLIDHLTDRLGAAIATAVNLLNPDVVVLGGGVMQSVDVLLDPVRRAVDRYALASHRRALRIVPAALGTRAGVVGAGLMAWKALAVDSDRAAARSR
jgi:glucokinase